MTSNRDDLAAVPIADRVAAGIALLDHEHPGWDQQIDLAVLELNDCGYCVLGQLFGEYRVGRETLHIEFPNTARLGFDRDDTDPTVTYDDLTAAWMDAIRARRAGAR